MPTLTYEDRTLAYLPFGAPSFDPETPVFVVISTEYRDTSSVAHIYGQFPETVSGIILDNTNTGQSSRLDRPLSGEEILAEFRFVCQSLGIRRPVPVGYCSNAELALFCARETQAAGVVLLSPLVRLEGGAFIEFLYGAMKKPILQADAYTLAVVMNLLDPHSKGLRDQRNYFVTDQFVLASELQNKDHFWIKTLQNKPVGRFEWSEMAALDCPVLVMRGKHDPIQPIEVLKDSLKGPGRRLVEFTSSHRILEDQIDNVIAEMCALALSLTKPTVQRAGVEA